MNLPRIHPCLWFDGQAAEAAAFYCSVFPDSAITQQNPMVTLFTIKGSPFMALNGGPQYQFSPAQSFFIYCENDEAEIDRLYEILSKDGQVMMPLGKYDWSPRYAWVQDKYGVGWQLDVEAIRSPQKVVPNLLFANDKQTWVKKAVDHYTGIFPESSILMEAPWHEGAGMPEGSLLFAQCKLSGHLLNAMSSNLAHPFDFTPAISLVVTCATQEEIDYYWEKLGKGGRYDQCGWLTDAFGVSWQIVPAILSTLMADPLRAPKVTQAFLRMQKFDIAALEKI